MISLRTSCRALALIGALALAGCSGDDDNDNGNGNGCTVVLSGGLSGTYDCVAFVAAYSTAVNTSSFAASITSPAAVAIAINFPGEAATGTYTRATPNASGGIVITSGTSSWSVSAGSGGTGAYTLTLTSVSTLSSTSQGKAYTVHGTLDATIPANSGSAITTAVTAHVTF
jgi:hypothetical protein